MNSSSVQYVGFIVAVLILTWAFIEINRRYFRRRRANVRSLNMWVRLNTGQPPATVEGRPASDDDEDVDAGNSSVQDLRTRASQNGHYSESRKPL